MNQKCYCLEILRKKFGPDIQGQCLELSCGRYRRELRKMDEKKLQEMKQVLDVQGSKGNFDTSEYMWGMYNGMELMMAIAEGREPVYKEKPDFSKYQYGEQFECVITNGYVAADTIRGFTEKGWKFVATVPAKLVHPHACETDKATIFSKYNPYPKYEEVAQASEPCEECGE
jgi:hypothetical protein